MWIARDEDGRVFMYEETPTKYISQWKANSSDFMKLNKDSYPNVKWEDKEPLEVKIIPEVLTTSRDPLKRFTCQHLNEYVSFNSCDIDICGHIVGYKHGHCVDYIILEVPKNKLGWRILGEDDVIVSKELKTRSFWYVKKEILKEVMNLDTN